MTGKIRVLEQDAGAITFEYMDGALSGRYNFMPAAGVDRLYSLYDKNFMRVDTTRAQKIVSDLKEEGMASI